MTQTKFYCKNKGRRLLLIENQEINGIDFLEMVIDNQRTLEVHFLNNLPGQVDGIPNNGNPLTVDNVLIRGGVRVKQIKVVSVSSNSNILTIEVDNVGDFSLYTLHIVNSSLETEPKPPEGFDKILSQVDFSFKANCPSDFDCKTETICAPGVSEEPRINYLAKDFSSFRRVMLDRLSLLVPEFKEKNSADLQMALVEILAYAGDHLSYYQDAIATEAYLFKARKRISMRRHSRLLDYHMHNGTNARVWVQIGIESGGNLDGGTIPKGTPLLTKGIQDGVTVSETTFEQMKRDPSLLIFETMHDLALHAAHNEIKFYTWGDSNCCLPKGSTSATLLDEGSLQLVAGDVLIFEEIKSPTTFTSADANPNHRHAVRLIEVKPGDAQDKLTNQNYVQIRWDEEDALPFPLCISSEIGGESAQDISVAHGNIVLADHGLTFTQQTTIPINNNDLGNYRPKLTHKNISVYESYDHEIMQQYPASIAYIQDPKEAIAQIALDYNNDTWEAKRDLLNSDRFKKEFVPEIEKDGTVFLRFGNDIHGEQPGYGFEPQATYRVGTGTIGNVGSEAIGRIVLDQSGATYVRNPLPAKGGRAMETMEEVRQFSPEAFRSQKRAVTEVDYAAKTVLHSEVQNAVAKFRWTGSWHTVFITVDRKNGEEVDNSFKEKIYGHLRKYNMAGYDLEIVSPLFVPLEIEMNICVKKGYFRNQVQKQLQQTFGNSTLSNGTKGFFHPDNFTFGQSLYLSTIYQQVLQIDGIYSVEMQLFKKRSKPDQGELKKRIDNHSFQ